jgi:hypothetical protein
MILCEFFWFSSIQIIQLRDSTVSTLDVGTRPFGINLFKIEEFCPVFCPIRECASVSFLFQLSNFVTIILGKLVFH